MCLFFPPFKPPRGSALISIQMQIQKQQLQGCGKASFTKAYGGVPSLLSFSLTENENLRVRKKGSPVGAVIMPRVSLASLLAPDGIFPGFCSVQTQNRMKLIADNYDEDHHHYHHHHHHRHHRSPGRSQHSNHRPSPDQVSCIAASLQDPFYPLDILR